MVIVVRKITQFCDTSQQGLLLHGLVSSEMQAGITVTIDFQGVHNATSSFINASIATIFDDFGYENAKKQLKIVNVNHQIAEILRAVSRRYQNIKS